MKNDRRITFWVDDETAGLLEQVAEADDRAVSDLCRIIVRERLLGVVRASSATSSPPSQPQAAPVRAAETPPGKKSGAVLSIGIVTRAGGLERAFGGGVH